MKQSHSLTPPPDRIDRRYVIGTAGHVDHGKSTLVRALTGIDPDRLVEEQRREMTIDLGFAWLTLPGGREVSMIDVPGHERFVGNMLAGIGGIDAALLVIAADDGPMPQTREHLAILDLLDVRHGVVALTRTDLVDDEWRLLVAEEIGELLGSTSLSGAPIVPVSAVSGEGLDDLKVELAHMLDSIQPRNAHGHPRLPVDRSFAISGFGTVVTGTLTDGVLRAGQELTVYPSGITVRVRGLQEHRRQVDHATAGSRVAVNLSGIDSSAIRRGDVIAPARVLAPSLRLDCRITLLRDAPAPLKHNSEVIVFTGASEAPAKVALLDRDELVPGDDGWVQLRLASFLVTLRGDRVILRRPSPATTIGGGVIVDPAPRRHKRHQATLIESLAVLAEGTAEDLILRELGDDILDADTLGRRAGVPDVPSMLPQLVANGEITVVGESGKSTLHSKALVMRLTVFERTASTIDDILADHHRRLPLSPGVRRDELRIRLGIPTQKPFDTLLHALVAQGRVLSDGAVVSDPEFEIRLSEKQRQTADAFLTSAQRQPYAPPSPDDHDLSPELVSALAALGEVERVSDQIVYPADIFAAIKGRVLAKLNEDGQITLAEYRDLFGTSRKYAQSTLEHLDALRFTRRKGDVRVKFVGPGAGS